VEDRDTNKVGVYRLPKHLDEESRAPAPRTHRREALQALQEAGRYLGVPVEGPYNRSTIGIKPINYPFKANGTPFAFFLYRFFDARFTFFDFELIS